MRENRCAACEFTPNDALVYDVDMSSTAEQIRGVYDPLRAPLYRVADVARYVAVHEATLRTWMFGRQYHIAGGADRCWPALFAPADPDAKMLSFTNVVEAYVLNVIRRRHQVKLSKARMALRYLCDHFGLEHPFAERVMETDGTDLFVREYGELLNVSRGGQVELQSFVNRYLARIKRNPDGSPIRLFPITRSGRDDDPRIPEGPQVVAIDPRVAFGHPVIHGTRITTRAVAVRFFAGESVADLAEDFERPQSEIEEALRCERALQIAA